MFAASAPCFFDKIQNFIKLFRNCQQANLTTGSDFGAKLLNTEAFKLSLVVTIEVKNLNHWRGKLSPRFMNFRYFERLNLKFSFIKTSILFLKPKMKS